MAEEDSKKQGEKEDGAEAGSKAEAKAEQKADAKADEQADAKAEAKSPWPSARKSVAPPPDKTTPSPAPGSTDEWPKKPWGEKLYVLDQKWTRLEARLLWWVLAAEIFLLCFTVLIGGLATDANGEAVSGIILRSTLGDRVSNT